MKQFKKYFISLAGAICLLVGCDKGFDDLNINKVDPITLDPQFGMNSAIIQTTYPDNFQTLGMLTYNFPIVQQIVTPSAVLYREEIITYLILQTATWYG